MRVRHGSDAHGHRVAADLRWSGGPQASMAASLHREIQMGLRLERKKGRHKQREEEERGNTSTCGTSVDGGAAPARREAEAAETEAGSRWISLPRVLLSLLVREGEGREEEGGGEAMDGGKLRRREAAAVIWKGGGELSFALSPSGETARRNEGRDGIGVGGGGDVGDEGSEIWIERGEGGC